MTLVVAFECKMRLLRRTQVWLMTFSALCMPRLATSILTLWAPRLRISMWTLSIVTGLILVKGLLSSRNVGLEVR